MADERQPEDRGSSGFSWPGNDTYIVYSAWTGKKRRDAAETAGENIRLFLCKIPMDIFRVFWQNTTLCAVFRPEQEIF